MQEIYIDDVGTGFPLVLVHGFLGSSEMWNLQKNFLRKNLKLLSNKFNFDLKFNQINLDNKLNSDMKIAEDFSLQSLPTIPTDYFLLVQGYGAGHGVGMSQRGAKAMAKRDRVFAKF